MAFRKWLSAHHPRDSKGRFARKGSGSARRAGSAPKKRSGPKVRKLSSRQRKAQIAIGLGVLGTPIISSLSKEAVRSAKYLALRKFEEKAARAAANRFAKELRGGARRATARAGVYTITTLAGRKFS